MNTARNPSPSLLFNETFFRKALALGFMGPAAKTAIPALLLALKGDNDPPLRAGAARSLVKLCKDDNVVVAAVLKAVNDKASGVPRDSAEALLWGSPWDKEDTVLAFGKCLNNVDKNVREAATNVLLEIDPVAAAKAGVNTNSSRL